MEPTYEAMIELLFKILELLNQQVGIKSRTLGNQQEIDPLDAVSFLLNDFSIVWLGGPANRYQEGLCPPS